MKRPDIETIKHGLKENINSSDSRIIILLINYIEYLESQQTEELITSEQLKKRMKELRQV
jgi:hypothetical protein